MQDSFIGTFDEHGLQSLTSEAGESRPSVRKDRSTFWAVLDQADLPIIRRAVFLGQRRSALEILLARARSLGGV